MPRTFIIANPYDGAPQWPCFWIALPEDLPSPSVCAFRLRFRLEEARDIRFHVSGDERYELFHNGERIGRGSERGDQRNWYFETYDHAFAPGEHTLVARVSSLGERAAFAQMSVYQGFILSPDSLDDIALLGTGVAAWECKILGGYEFTDPLTAWGTGANLILHGDTFDWGFELGEGTRWQPARKRHPGNYGAMINDYPPLHLMTPATLPPMLEMDRCAGRVRHLAISAPQAVVETHPIPILERDHRPREAALWQKLLIEGVPLTVPAATQVRVLVDLEDYYCAYPEAVTSGGAGSLVRLNWQESLFEDIRASSKGNRDEIEGKFFVTCWWPRDGVGDTFLPDGGPSRRFDTLWWQCGRYVEIVVRTAEEPLTLERLTLRETRYPLEMEAEFAASHERLAGIIPLLRRGLQMCSHETYMDCPYYEQIQYIGDTRLQVLTTYVLTGETRLPRKANQMFDASRLPAGYTQSRYPSRVVQQTRTFSVWWVAMLHDHALWRGEPELIAEHMHGARNVLDSYARHRNADGLIEVSLFPNGGFIDWAKGGGWHGGVPHNDGKSVLSSVLNWQYALVLRQAAELEEWLGEPELAARWRRWSGEIAAATVAAFWNEERGMFADDTGHAYYSEHAQSLALLSGLLSPDHQSRTGHGLLHAPDLTPATIYFSHYVFEAYRLLGEPNALLDRLQGWFELKALGLRTPVEMPEPTRSDCHAWGSHPLYHYFATILGIRPAGFGFDEVEISPQLGRLEWAAGKIPHPRGEIMVKFRREDGALRGEVQLPNAVTGRIVWNGREMELQDGRQQVQFSPAPP